MNSHPRRAARQATEHRLLTRWLEHGEIEAREELLHRLLPVARRLARRYEMAGEPIEDLVQVACVGLMKAVDRFDPERGSSLRTYAERMAEGELRHHARAGSGLLHMPRALHERARAVSRTGARLAAGLGRAATPSEIAERLRLSTADVRDALQAAAALEGRSLQDPRPDVEEPRLSYEEQLGEEDPGFELVEDRSVIAGVWRSLTPRERESLRLRVAEDLTYREIAGKLGVSTTQAVRVVTRALERLRAVADAAE